ncbi:hypothetical protein CR513_18127, partial [Mucuna pruriens]
MVGFTVGKSSTIYAYVKIKANETPQSQASNLSTLPPITQITYIGQQFKVPRIEGQVDISLLEKDIGKRSSIWQYFVDQRDKICRAYIKLIISTYKYKVSRVGPNSLHKRFLKFCDDLINQTQHIEKIFDMQSVEIIANNYLRLKTSIDAIR